MRRSRLPFLVLFSPLHPSPGQRRRTMVQNKQESRREYWAIRLSVCLLTRLHHSLICLLTTACYARTLHCAHSFACLLTCLLPSSWGCLKTTCFCPTVCSRDDAQEAVHCGPEQPVIQTAVLGHSLVCLLVCLHCSLICLLHTACFACVQHSAHLIARSLTHS